MENKNIVKMDLTIPFAQQLKAAEIYAKSNIVPKDFRGNPSNCFIAIDIATRNNMSPMLVMQNLNIIYGTPAWSSKYIIAMINACGKFEQLQFKIDDLGIEKNIEYISYEYDKIEKKNMPVKKIYPEIHNQSCYAYSTIKDTGKEIRGAIVSIKMAVQEGWYTKNGSKWQTMPELMLRYRAASFFGSQYAPDKTMGILTMEEIVDIKQEERNITPIKTNEDKLQTENIKTENKENDSTANELLKKIQDETKRKEFIKKAKDIMNSKLIPNSNITDEIIEEQIDCLKKEIMEAIDSQNKTDNTKQETIIAKPDDFTPEDAAKDLDETTDNETGIEKELDIF